MTNNKKRDYTIFWVMAAGVSLITSTVMVALKRYDMAVYAFGMFLLSLHNDKHK